MIAQDPQSALFGDLPRQIAAGLVDHVLTRNGCRRPCCAISSIPTCGPGPADAAAEGANESFQDVLAVVLQQTGLRLSLLQAGVPAWPTSRSAICVGCARTG